MEKLNKKNKDKLHREKEKELKELVTQLVNMILGDESFRDRKLSKRKESITKAIELLKTKEFAVKPPKSFSANEVDESPPNFVSLKENGVKLLHTAKESQSFGEQLKQIMTILESMHQPLDDVNVQSFGEQLKQIMTVLEAKHQSLDDVNVITTVANLLKIGLNSCSIMAADLLLNSDCAHQVKEHHRVEREGEKLILKFPQTPDSFQIKEKGKNVEVDNQEMIDQEKQGNQVILTFRSEAGRLGELTLSKKITNQEMGPPVVDLELKSDYWNASPVPLSVYDNILDENIILDELWPM